MEASPDISQRGAFQHYNIVKHLALWLGAYSLTAIMLAPFHIGRALFGAVRVESMMQSGNWLNPASSGTVIHLLEFFAAIVTLFVASHFFRFSKWRLALVAMSVQLLHAFSLALTYGLTPAQLLDPVNTNYLVSVLSRLANPLAGLIVGLAIARLFEPSSTKRHDEARSGWNIVPRKPNSRPRLMIVFGIFCGITLCISGGAMMANSLPKLVITLLVDGYPTHGIAGLILVLLEIIFALGIAVIISRAAIAWFEQATPKLICWAVGFAFVGFAVSDITMGIFYWIRGSNLRVENLANSPLTDHLFNEPALIDAVLAVGVVAIFMWLRRNATRGAQTFSNPLLEVKEAMEAQERSAHGG